MSNPHLRFLPALLALMVAACSTLPQTPSLPPSAAPSPHQYQAHLQQISKIHYFAFNGRIAILTDAKGFSGGLRWHHHGEGDDLDFYSPLGTQLGKLTRDANGVTLITSTQKTLHAKDAATLTQQALGWSLPMDGLTDWVLGRPSSNSNPSSNSASSAAEILAWDQNGNITHMKQQGWDIQYAGYATSDGVALPQKITLKSQKLDLKLVVEAWETGTD